MCLQLFCLLLGLLSSCLDALSSFGLRAHAMPYCLVISCLLSLEGLLFYNGIKGNFIRVQGICRQIETTGIRKRIKNLYIDMEPYTLKMPVRHRIRNLIRGDTVIIYLSEKTPVYEQDKGYMICSYYALESKKEKEGWTEGRGMKKKERPVC